MAGRSRSKRTPLGHLWGFMTSRKVTVVLLLGIAVLLGLGLWLPQEPGDLDAAGLEQWWAAAEARYGGRWVAYDRLGLLHLYRTPTFLALLSALLVNALACTVDRLGRLWRAVIRIPRWRR